VPEDRRVLELYAGCGPLGLPLLARSRTVVFNEVSPAGLAGLALGLAARPADEQARARVLPGEAGAAPALAALADADVVIADPPRQGLDAPLLEALRGRPPERLILVACETETFVAQARALTQDGRLRLRELLAFEMFPYTRHVETLARFERQAR
jgi:23S rRNA (uracil1939-C5)-methyltransferase